MAEGKSSGVNKCMATAHSAKLVSHSTGTPDCAVAYEVSRQCDFQVLGALKAIGLASFLFLPRLLHSSLLWWR